MNDFDELVRTWDGELFAVHRDAASGATMIVCVHRTVDGRSGGGCRIRVYPRLGDALLDAQRLSAAMSLKFAVNGLRLGGGKSVLAVPELPAGKQRRELLLAFGAFLETLGGIYGAAPDVNTSAEDMDVIGEVTSHVYCRTTSAGGSGDTGLDTAVGVFHGIAATVRYAMGTDLRGRRIAVQGLGGVGAPLAERLVAAGASVLGADVSPESVAALAPHGVVPVPLDEVLEIECDVLAPCALGAVLNADTISRLRCRIVAGAANNQLAEPVDADRLRERGILYAPDFVINSGGVLHGVGLDMLHWSRQELDQRLEAIGDILTRVYTAADARGITTEIAARQLAGELAVSSGATA